MKNKEIEKFIGITHSVSLRKSAFFESMCNKINKKISENLDSREMIKLKDALKNIIANMNNELFLSKEEIKNKKINPKTPLHELNLDEEKIIKNFKRTLKREYPNIEIWETFQVLYELI